MSLSRVSLILTLFLTSQAAMASPSSVWEVLAEKMPLVPHTSTIKCQRGSCLAIYRITGTDWRVERYYVGNNTKALTICEKDHCEPLTQAP